MDATAENKEREGELGGQMSFMEHLDELRRRLINSFGILIVAFLICFYFSNVIFNFLAVPIRRALDEVQRDNQARQTTVTADQPVGLAELKEGDLGKYVFEKNSTLSGISVSGGTSIDATVRKDAEGKLVLVTSEPIITNRAVIPKGTQLPVNLTAKLSDEPDALSKLIVTTAMESFTLYVTVSLYSAVALALPLLLLQVWGFISPALYQHEKRYVTPFIFLSSISFVIGAAFAYYILFPPAVKYLLGVGADFDIMIKATEYFDFITLIMLAMGLIFQMPAITYVLSRIGIVTAGLLVRAWKISLVVILIVAAVASPTSDIPNMMLFAAPMIFLYGVSIFVAWFFGKKRTPTAL